VDFRIVGRTRQFRVVTARLRLIRQAVETSKFVLFFFHLPLPRVTIQVDYQFPLLQRRRGNYAEPRPCGNLRTGLVALGSERQTFMEAVAINSILGWVNSTFVSESDMCLNRFQLQLCQTQSSESSRLTNSEVICRLP